ncbi:MAG: GNAT family N-acetyltransferase [Draconibacterium sp.]|nr:GNAT family N-acetyltransferase [Draconibacterium sp.]
MDIIIKPLTPELLNDYLYFFDNIVFTDNPDWSACYCFSFHFTGTNEQWNKEGNRSSAIRYINEGKMLGYLAYAGDKPVGWCNVNNRQNYERLLKYYDLIDNPNDNACSIVCFLIDPDYRRKGIAQKIIEQICADYALQNYDYIEAYPGKGKLSCEGHFKGPLELYEKFDFKIEKEYDNYFVVRKQLK